MGVIECPFFPGKRCYGTCPNNHLNEESIQIEASVTCTPAENIRVERNLNPLRFFEAQIAKIYNHEYYEECERYPLN